MKLLINRMDKEVPLPRYLNEHDAALDLHSSEDATLAPGEKKLISTGLKMAIPKDHVGLIWDRSGLAAKHSLHTMAGVIDSGYRGEVKIVLVNLGTESFLVEKGTRIAQMLVQPMLRCNIEEVDALDDTERGHDGFGSTGLK